MSTIGFDPERTVGLALRVRSSADELAGITCSDPLAADALRVVALTEHNLRTSWLPLLDRIAATGALTTWIRSGPGGRPGLPGWPMPPTPHVATTLGAAVLTRLRVRAGAIRHGVDGRPVDDDAGGPWLDSLVAGVRHCLALDPGFRDELLAQVTRDPSTAWLLLSEELDAALRADVLTALLGSVGRVHGMEWGAVAGAAERLMVGLSEHPAAALHALGRRDTLWLLAEWPTLDQAAVADFVHAGLAVAVRDEPSLHPDGVRVLLDLVHLANQPRLDHVGFLPGVAVGTASAVGAYAPSFVDTIRLESATVTVRSSGVDGELDATFGTYDELVEFFGAMMRDEPAAQHVLGTEVAALARLAVAGGEGVPSTVRVDSVAEFTELLQHAAANENEESRVAAAARRAGALDSSTLFGFTTSALFLAGGRGHPVAAFVLDRGVKDLVDLAARPRPVPTPVTVDMATATHQVIVMAAIGRAASDPSFRRSAGIGGSSLDWAKIEGRIAEIEELAADGPEPSEMDRHLHQLEADAREAGAGDYLDELLQRPAVHDLTAVTSQD